MGKFIMFSALLFVILLIAGGISFMFSMQQIIRTNKSRELTQMLETEQIRLESSLNPEIAIVLKLANSPIVKKHLMNPTDPELEQIAREEMFSYRDAFSGYSIFWMNDIDKMFYSDENEPYFVDVDDPVNYWYHLTVRDTERYNFNINYNPDIDEIKLWINAPVFDEAHNAVGMVGTGIELSMFVNATYKNIDERTELYFFAADGKIFGARKEELIVSRANIADVLQGLNIDILAENKTLKQGEVKLFDIPNGIVSTGATSLSNWHFVAIMEYSLADYDLAMTVLFVVVFVVILFIFVIFNMFIARLLKSLQKATDVLVLTVKMREQGLIADNEMLDRMNQMKYEFFQ
ncbi:MAG: cache domain-containing protein, partial [Clostridiales bacterium]|nr:cache domain-containing protein [Clostridiales bacterium]